MRGHGLLTLAITTGVWLAADGAEGSHAEQLVRAGKPVQALRELSNNKHGMSAEEALYWRGRALIELGRLAEAYECLQNVPQQHPLFPYAARGMLYCAKHNPDLDGVVLAERLSVTKDEQIRLLAAAVLAEHQLGAPMNEVSDTSAYTRLQELAAQNEKLEPVVKILGVLLRRKLEDYSGGIEYARSVENDPSLNSFMRQLVRLELAELYYAKEKAFPQQEESQTIETDEDDTTDTTGMGEETLLQFITANPESPLLAEAFRRLRLHESSDCDAYARTKLTEWAEDTTHARRAAYALLMLMEQDEQKGTESAALANRAANDLPGEPLTRVMLQEYIRRLILRGDYEQASLYANLVDSLQPGQSDTYTCFLRALLARKTPSLAAELFRSCAETAGDDVRVPTLVNALICYMTAGNFSDAEQLIKQTKDPRERRNLLLAHVEMLPANKTELARSELQEILNLKLEPDQQVRARLCALRLSLNDNPRMALKQLETVTSEELASWSDDNALLYAALLEHASDAVDGGKQERTNARLKKLCAEASSLSRREVLSLHLADRFSKVGQHAAARDVLLDLSAKQPAGPAKAATLFYAAKECAACATLSSLQHAAQLFAECARLESSLTSIAIIEQAAILTRINRCDEALDLIEPMKEDKLSAELRARRLTVMADAYAIGTEPDHVQRALTTSERILGIPKLSHVWVTRAYLQHAIMAVRAKSNEMALQDYLHVLREHDTGGTTVNDACTFLYYYAGAGAVYLLVRMERYQEAADLADHIAKWSGSEQSTLPRNSEKASSFSAWASSIRRTHYLPTSILKSDPEESRRNKEQ